MTSESTALNKLCCMKIMVAKLTVGPPYLMVDSHFFKRLANTNLYLEIALVNFVLTGLRRVFLHPTYVSMSSCVDQEEQTWLPILVMPYIRQKAQVGLIIIVGLYPSSPAAALHLQAQLRAWLGLQLQCNNI